MKQVQEQAAHDAAASARADAEKIRTLLKQREDELKKLQKELDEKETYYSPAALERERKRMEGAIEADRRRETETLQRQIKELEHRVAIRGAESDTVARQLKEKDDLIRMLSDREDELQKDIKSRDEKVAGAQEEVNAAREQLNGAAGKEKELNDKLKQKNVQLAQLGKERGELVQELAKNRGTYEDIVHDRDELKAKIEALHSEMRVAATGNQLRGDWEARFQSAADERDDLKKLVSRMRIELLQAREAAARSGGGTSRVDEGLLRLVGARADVHETLVAQMLEGVNNAVSLLRRNSELLKGYVEDCGLLANAVRKIDYTRLEPEQQQMLVELVDQTQPDVIVKNMQGIGEENAESIVKAKKLILDYSDAFKKEEDGSVEVEAALARAQGLLHATDPNADVPVKIEAVLPAVNAGKEEAVLFCYALLREAKLLSPEDGGPTAVNVNTDGLSVTFTLAPVEAKAKERYREPADAQSRLVCEFARERCGGKAEFKEEDGKRALLVTLKAKN